MGQKFCEKCKRTLDEGQFYTYKSGDKVELCKKCITMHIDNYNPETFLYLLQKMDVPYIEHEWDTLRDRAYAKLGPKKMTGMSVFGKYLSKMKLKQWSGYTWEDTEKLQEDAAKKMQSAAGTSTFVRDEDILKEKLESGEITEAEYKTLTEMPAVTGPPADMHPQHGYYPESNPYPEVDLPDVTADLTEDDLKYLAMKWGRFYKAHEWVTLERFYTEMMDSFDVQSAAREDTVIKLAKTSLKMDETIDLGDIDTYQKLSRVYDTLMKSGKFSEAQNKDQDKGFVNSIGELVALCEHEGGFIPPHDVEADPDIVDRTIQDMNKYVYNLVTKELGLAQQIEDAIKKIDIQRQMDEDEEAASADAIDDFETIVLEDADIEEFYDTVALEKEFDLKGEEDGSQ